MSSLDDLVASQDALLREAALALPHEFSRCTFNLGPVRQAVYLCLTCAIPRGICASCSIACHTHHEQVELFPKRGFRCDCPTTALAHPCTLHKSPELENATNQYGQNFRALFCRCAKPYDPKTERETMIQCLACEDWFHESCLNLRDRPPPREPSPDAPDPEAADDHSEVSSDLPPPLISADDYESFVCAACVARVPILRRYAGTKGTIMIVRDAEGAAWKRLDGEPPDDSPTDTQVHVGDTPGSKRQRSHSSSADGPEQKRPRTSTPAPCLTPPASSAAQAIFDVQPSGFSIGAGDIFLTEGFRQRWCRCDRCLPCLQAHPYLLEEEDTYEPPEDPDSGLSFEELGARALERLPRDRALDGIHAFNDMRDHLFEYLRPFAQQGKVVEEADVTRFFDDLKQKRAQVD